MKDQLFVLTPGFDDRGTTYFCPYSAQVIGFLAYYPQVRATIDLVGRKYVEKTKEILRYLAVTRGVPVPH